MNRLTLAAIAGGGIAGVLDILYAFVVYGPLTFGLSPMQVLQSVAAGWIGRDAARAGGWTTASIGLATHFMIATVMAAVFVLAASRFKLLTANAVVAGLAYGLVLYVVMNYVVLALAATHPSHQFAATLTEAVERLRQAFSEPSPRDPWLLAGTILTHTAFVGLPIALVARHFLQE